jgi:hypothetical protein
VALEATPQDGTYFSSNTTGKWKTARFSTRTGATSLQVDATTGRVHVLIGDTELRYYTKSPTGKWGVRKLASVNVLYPSIRLDPTNGTLLVVYFRPDGPGGVYAMTRQ